MKPPETVTLIDLEGNILQELNTEGEASFRYCSITTYEDSGGYYCTELKHGTYEYHRASKEIGDDGLPNEKRVLQYKLVDFLNDQLTFIRNGMWETLAIYQATLGRYTDVPWYRLSIDCLRETKQMGKLIKLLDNNNVEATGFYQFGGIESPIFNAENVKGLEYETVRVSLDYFKAWKPNYNDFIQYYHDIFSKLTPLEGK